MAGEAPIKFIDTGANLLDSMFRGVYRGSQKHADDLIHVLSRAWETGIQKIILTTGSLSEAESAITFCRQYIDHEDARKGYQKAHPSEESAEPEHKPYLQSSMLSQRPHNRIFTTVGVHPTRCMELEKGGDAYLEQLLKLAKEYKGKSVVAIGECGLDWERLEFCPKDVQLRWFEAHFTLAEQTGLPMFLHMRGSAEEELQLLSRHRHRFSGGVVHSFDDTVEVAHRILDLGLYIGLNGCSLRTEASLEVVKALPRERILLETDAPWCDIRPTHAGFKHVRSQMPAVKPEKFVLGQRVKGRNEPSNILQVCEVVAGVRGESVAEVAAYCWQNTLDLFFPHLK